MAKISCIPTITLRASGAAFIASAMMALPLVSHATKKNDGMPAMTGCGASKASRTKEGWSITQNCRNGRFPTLISQVDDNTWTTVTKVDYVAQPSANQMQDSMPG
jgi:hypothetical protein